ncbi:hypothetical protein GQX74_012431 [Glossina fuscipes]|nr:hypothetical protein GQX74_012431 [Glossina fuscipes]
MEYDEWYGMLGVKFFLVLLFLKYSTTMRSDCNNIQLRSAIIVHKVKAVTVIDSDNNTISFIATMHAYIVAISLQVQGLPFPCSLLATNLIVFTEYTIGKGRKGLKL